ncbi:DUF3601 domain-containing protein [Pedobacter boryungensis]|uniref:DUF3601 domain-containing protein n=1 Tax=Pedobacter boryungensis TaxID=869962 RepID=A0ABX2DFF7_9SPHI|nr:DUF3601 domain-containing protein [Pedobacter boryungensis]NQX32289.1 DUF3601 domain-containing protein [Pedobacter boryungensis]
MNNLLHLKIGQVYQVKKTFIDFDGIVHDIGEIWTYQGTNFLAHADGLHFTF